MKRLTTLLAVSAIPFFLTAQVNNLELPLSINATGNDPDSSAILDVQSTDKGMLVPRMTTTQRTAISNPATGLLVFDNETAGFWFYNGNEWTELTGGTSWSLSGNAGTEDSINFIGTTDNVPLDFKVNDLRALRIIPTLNSVNIIGGYSGNSITGIGVEGAAIAGGGMLNAENSITADYGFIGSGAGNSLTGYSSVISGGRFNQATGASATIGGGEFNIASGNTCSVGGGSFNEAHESGSTVGGGIQNIASKFGSTVGGGQSNTATATTSTVGGGSGNKANGINSTVAGGAQNEATESASTVGGGSGNKASKFGSTVGGGQSNTALETNSTVGGGFNNTASGFISTVGGGQGNTASSEISTVGGGFNNTASGFISTVGGGWQNTSSGNSSTVPGGRQNSAGGDFSYASGRRAKIDATHDGAFMYADGNDLDFNSAAANEFAVRATGGVRFVTEIDGSGNPTHTVSIDTNGHVGIGTTNPSSPLHIDTTLDNGTLMMLTNNGTGNANILKVTSGSTGPTDIVDIQNGAFVVEGNGNVGIGTTSPGHPLQMGSGAHCTAAGVWTNASDIAKKYDIQPLSYGLSEVLQLKPVAYNYKSDQSKSIGFIAQEMETIIPEVVSGEEGEKGVAYGLLTSVLVKAIQEQEDKIKKQKQMIDAQQKRIATLENQNALLLSQNAQMGSEIKAIKAALSGEGLQAGIK